MLAHSSPRVSLSRSALGAFPATERSALRGDDAWKKNSPKTFPATKKEKEQKIISDQYSSMFSIAEHFGADQQTTKLLLGNKSERAQKIFALDYCSGAFVTEGASPGPPAPLHQLPHPAAVAGRGGLAGSVMASFRDERF